MGASLNGQIQSYANSDTAAADRAVRSNGPEFPRPRLAQSVPAGLMASAAPAFGDHGHDDLSARQKSAQNGGEGFRAIADRVARSGISVLLTGETGSGKEVLARRIHAESPRAAKPFVGINCAAICENLLESELFGYQRGAFTGADQSRVGLIESANGGTVFFDELGELSPSAQAKLLRVIETRMVLPIGATRPRPVDVRFVSATNVDMEAAVARGSFRADLFFRLAVFCSDIPPLRARIDDVIPAAHQFLAEFAKRERIPLPAIGPGVEDALTSYRWPGNFRELRNVIERAAVVCANGNIEVDDLGLPHTAPGVKNSRPAAISSEQQGDRARIIEALSRCAGNQTRAARMLGISRRTLISRLDEFGIARPQRQRLRAVTDERSCG